MDESILFPSPNWFQVSGLAVSKDKWMIYGGPSKSLCIVEPVPSGRKNVVEGAQAYKAHIFNKVHTEKIICVDISPEWPEKRTLITGCVDGGVKQWNIQGEYNNLKVKSTHSHEIHCQGKEELIGAGYSTDTLAITVGCYGNITKWDLHANLVKVYSTFLKKFRPLCMSCSRHIPLHVAVGTKQGVIFVVDLTSTGKIVYKVRGQDEEIINVSWCPQYQVEVKKILDPAEKPFSLSDRLERIRNEPEPSDAESVDMNASGAVKMLPEDSFDETIVEEDDTFNIYQDHEEDEFGHKKFQPEDVVVKIKQEVTDDDYLSECAKLKEDILKRKTEIEQSMESLVDAMDKSQIDDKEDISEDWRTDNKCNDNLLLEASDHVHKHLLAAVGKLGGVRIWSKTGKLVSTCTVSCNIIKSHKYKATNWPTLLWMKPNMLLIADGKSQLLECDPLIINCKNKLEWRVVHSHHKRGLFCIASDAPKVQTPDMLKDEQWSAWTVSQQRDIVRYCMKTYRTLAFHATCGGFIYAIKPCPYDAGRVAVSVGDGAVRVWQTHTMGQDDTKLSSGYVLKYWQNVQGKILTVAWHPTRENLLAFGTAESRVGLIDTSGKIEKAARVFLPALSGGVYSLCWGEEYDLYACGSGDLILYNALKPEDAPRTVFVTWEGQNWEISHVLWTPRVIVVGSNTGAVALLTSKKPHVVITVAFLFSKMIHTIDWHPQETSCSSEESQYKNLIAVCSLDKSSVIAILECTTKEDGVLQLTAWKNLVGHKYPVLEIQWNPHREGQLLSTSQDSLIMVWDVGLGACTHIFAGHCLSSLGASWNAFPQLRDTIISGGGDCTLRLWNINDHPADSYEEPIKKDLKMDKKYKAKKDHKKDLDFDLIAEENRATNSQEAKLKASKKFLLPGLYKQTKFIKILAVRKMLEKLESKNSKDSDEETGDIDKPKGYDVEFIKIFGTINDVNDILDKEMQRHYQCGNFEARIMLMIFRGHIDAMIQFASQRDMLCPYLLSIAPCVSLRYWKDASQLYLAQIDRFVARGEEDKLSEHRLFGGPVFRKAATLLSVHDVKGAVDALAAANQFKEAYVLCRIRYMDSIAENILEQWAVHSDLTGLLTVAAMCYIALGKISNAARVLGRADDQDVLSLAADVAKLAGQTSFADHIERKVQTKIDLSEMNAAAEGETEEPVKDLPSRIELLLSDAQN